MAMWGTKRATVRRPMTTQGKRATTHSSTILYLKPILSTLINPHSQLHLHLEHELNQVLSENWLPSNLLLFPLIKLPHWISKSPFSGTKPHISHAGWYPSWLHKPPAYPCNWRFNPHCSGVGKCPTWTSANKKGVRMSNRFLKVMFKMHQNAQQSDNPPISGSIITPKLSLGPVQCSGPERLVPPSRSPTSQCPPGPARQPRTRPPPPSGAAHWPWRCPCSPRCRHPNLRQFAVESRNPPGFDVKIHPFYRKIRNSYGHATMGNMKTWKKSEDYETINFWEYFGYPIFRRIHVQSSFFFHGLRV